jgi:hypothetical protein
VSFDYSQSAATAARLIEKFGTSVIMSRTVPGAYNPATGAPGAGTTTTQTVKAAVLDFPQSYIDGTLIRAGDRRVLVSAVGTTAPLAGDTFPWKSQALVVVKVKELGPAGVAVLYTLQVRTP